MNNLSELTLENKKLIIRVDMNVPIHNGAVYDQTRILASIPTIKYCLGKGAKILLVSHLGRPIEGEPDSIFSLKPIAECLIKILGEEVDLVSELNDTSIFNSSSRVQGEKANSNILGKLLADCCDIYVFDAFGTSHREQASTHSAIVQSNQACAGLLLVKEITALTKVLNEYENPYTAVIGGSKVSTKLELIKNINTKADFVIVGGGIANTFIKAAGHEVGISLYEESMLDIAKDLLDGGKIILPDTVITSLTFEGEEVSEKNISDVNSNEMILDQLLTTKMIEAINASKTILWNGPLGVFENQLFEIGTRDLAQAIAASSAFSIAGGGETISAINKFIKADDVSYCSTGGGAFLEFMEGKDLPSIQALKSKS
jgi:phosphoglycerate kinase